MKTRQSTSKNSPYTEQEKLVMYYLTKAWSAFLTLPKTHPCHNSDFSDGIHKCQDVIIHRIVQRDYPESFPSYTGNEI